MLILSVEGRDRSGSRDLNPSQSTRVDVPSRSNQSQPQWSRFGAGSVGFLCGLGKRRAGFGCLGGNRSSGVGLVTTYWESGASPAEVPYNLD
jgi:hypothetical protein